MASAAFSTGCVLPIETRETRPAAAPAAKHSTTWSWRATADTVSGLTFLAALGWTLWHIGSVALQLVPQVIAAGGGYLF